MFVFFLVLSFMFFITGIFYAIYMRIENKSPWQSFLLIVLITTAISMWLSVLPLVKEGAVIYKPLYAAFYVLESAVGNVDYSLFSDALPKISIWRIYTILLHLMMPVTTYGVILLYFFKAFGWFRYTLFRGSKEIFLFSNLTEKSKAYAKRLKADNRLMIFCNTEDEQRKDYDEEFSTNMVFTNQSEMEILRQIEKRDLTIMEMGEDEFRNVQKSVEIINYLKGIGQNDENKQEKLTFLMALYQKIKEFLSIGMLLRGKNQKTVLCLDSVKIYTVANSPIACTVMDNAMGRNSGKAGIIKFQQTVINEFKRIAFKLLIDQPLYEYIDKENKTLDVLIVGFGRMGQEVLKAVSWAGYFPGIDTNIHVISRQGVQNGEKLLSECPELGIDLGHEKGFIKPVNGTQLNPKAPIYYYSTETNVPGFDEIIRSLIHCRYIVVSLGDDTDTLTTAIHIYRLIMQQHYLHPELNIGTRKIQIRIRDNENFSLISSDGSDTVFKHLEKFGSDEDIYTYTGVGESVLDKIAGEVNKIYNGDDKDINNDDYAQLPEYKKNSNQAAALHALYKFYFSSGVKDEQKPGDSRVKFSDIFSNEDTKKLAAWEHIRWQAYMRTEGYIGIPYRKIKMLFDTKNQKNFEEAVKQTRCDLQEARIHPTVGSDEEQLTKLGELIGKNNDPDHFHRNDRKLIDAIPQIINSYFQIEKSKKE